MPKDFNLQEAMALKLEDFRRRETTGKQQQLERQQETRLRQEKILLDIDADMKTFAKELGRDIKRAPRRIELEFALFLDDAAKSGRRIDHDEILSDAFDAAMLAVYIGRKYRKAAS